MSTDALFAKALTSCWKIPGLPASSCIGSAKIAQAVLRELGVSSTPVPCAIWVGNEEAVDLLDAGLDTSLWPPSAFSIGVNPDIPPDAVILPLGTRSDNRTGGFNGHIILEGDGWIADYSAAQFSRPAKRIKMGPWALRPGVEAKVTDLGWQLINRHGTAVIIETRRELASWRNTPDWRMDVPRDLVERLVGATRDRLLNAVAVANARKELEEAGTDE